jgi:hypothetical protein
MDPFIEGQVWKGFHTRFLAVLSEMLVAQLRPRYVVQIEEYVYLAREDEEPDRLFEPDLAVVEGLPEASTVAGGSAAAATLAPAIHIMPLPRQHRQRFLSIRNTQSRKIVTVIELLTPSNKTPGDGWSEYLVKRSNIFYTPAHLVEIDLLRCGQRLPTREPLAAADFFVFVCRRQRLPQAEVYGRTLRDRLPVVPIPLAGDDPDTQLDLQSAFTTTYDCAGYDYALDYHAPVEPPLEAPVAQWVRSVVGT